MTVVFPLQLEQGAKAQRVEAGQGRARPSDSGFLFVEPRSASCDGSLCA